MVPFCPESEMSGVGYRDFMNCVWYRRSFVVPDEWKASGRTVLCFGAVDYKTTVYVNGTEIGFHAGGVHLLAVIIHGRPASGRRSGWSMFQRTI